MLTLNDRSNKAMNDELLKTQIELGKALKEISKLKKQKDFDYDLNVFLPQVQEDLQKLQCFVIEKGLMTADEVFTLQSRIEKVFYASVIDGIQNKVARPKTNGAKELMEMIASKDMIEKSNELDKQTQEQE